jgi:preprotein translocase subunit SecG
MWATTAVGALMLFAAYAGTKGIVSRSTAIAALFLAGACLVLVLYLAAKARSQAIADRERESGQAMIVVIAAELARQDDPTLERIVTRGGPAADAARLILAGRRKARMTDGQASPA